MKKFLILILTIGLLLSGCGAEKPAQLAATTAPVWEFATRLCQGTDITVTRLVTESVSCLHDYTLQVRQMKAIESADAVILSGGGLEEFLEDAIGAAVVIDCSAGMELHCPEEEHHYHDDHGHSHATDPHFWLSPIHASHMAENLCAGLCSLYPQYTDTFRSNLNTLLADLEALQTYGESQFKDLSSRELITFHDGFGYFAECFGLEIHRSVEEESGSEASASDLIELIQLVRHHDLKAIFIEANGADSAARIISAETDVPIYSLDMAMAGDSYFETMYRNIDTVKEALG